MKILEVKQFSGKRGHSDFIVPSFCKRNIFIVSTHFISEDVQNIAYFF